MSIYFVHGYRHMGACDYFSYEGQQFHVTSRMFHIQHCPFSSDQPRLRLPGLPSIGLDVSDVPGAASRCFKWAALRWHTLILGVFFCFFAFVFMCVAASGLGIAQLAAGVSLLLLSLGAFLQRPAPPAYALEMYIDKIQRFSRILAAARAAAADEGPPEPARHIPLLTATVPMHESSLDLEAASPSGQDDKDDAQEDKPLLRTAAQ
ncbi:unnamed protein product [Ostreobium quekettii]|uniref:Uncharacterized protein n=1 Tax=Ostreobium quekettii TaxID=121088 RepID=A0A8S1J312_9CHLO|nr:unnamed protein product [Ostreobium quekettii]